MTQPPLEFYPPGASVGTSRPRIGILTSGGDCPGLNAVLRAATKTGYWLGYEVLGFKRGFEGLVDPISYKLLTNQNTAGILTRGGTILGSTNKGRFGARVGVDGVARIDPALLEKVRVSFDQLRLEGLIVVGGDGSLSTAQQFHEADLPVVGVPKTIDNDLSATAFTFGFNSAVLCCADALDRLHTTADSHERVMVLEVMGRHTGWIALHGGIAGGADVILIPEVSWSYDNIIAKIKERRQLGKKFTLICVAEGAHLPGGALVTDPGHGGNLQPKLGGIGHVIASELDHRIEQDVRCVVLGHLQRGGSPHDVRPRPRDAIRSARGPPRDRTPIRSHGLQRSARHTRRADRRRGGRVAEGHRGRVRGRRGTRVGNLSG